MGRQLTIFVHIAVVIGSWKTVVSAERMLPPYFLLDNSGPAALPSLVFRDQQFEALYRQDQILFRTGNSSMQLDFRGANKSVKLSPIQPGGRINILKGNDPARWATGLQAYSGLVYAGLYQGIDMRWELKDNALKSEFVLAPRADVRAIRLHYSGTAVINLDASGDLLFHFADAEIREHAPQAYFFRNGSRITTPAHFRIGLSGEVSFEVGQYDSGSTLIIDPQLSYSTLLGGMGSNVAASVAVDASGNTYLAGSTESLDFPVTGGLPRGSGVDAFVAKFTVANTLAYCTYLGGSGDDRATGITVDSSGNATIVGSTTSPNMPFVNAVQPALHGVRDAFIAKLNSSGNGLIFGTYFGGSGSDDAAGIALDTLGNIYVAGATSSTDLPILNAAQSTLKGPQNGYILKLNPSGQTIVYSSFLGGSGMDTIAAIAVDWTGSAYVAGNTMSPDFPVTSAIFSKIPGQQSGFVTKLDASGQTLVYSTFLGGSGGTTFTPEGATAIAVDSTGAAYVTGLTSSTDFPVMNAYQAISSGGTHAFVTKINSTGKGLVFSTYFGGSGRDLSTGIALNGSIYIAGYTSSVDFPVLNAVQTSNAGFYDAFFARFSIDGALIHSSYLGGTSIDAANAIAIDPWGNVVLSGQTSSGNFPLVTPFQSGSGHLLAFLSKFSDTNACTYTVSPTSLNVPSGASTLSITVTTSPTCNWSALSYQVWVGIVSGQNGAGTGTLLARVGNNQTSTARTDVLTIAGQTVTINQSGQNTLSCGDSMIAYRNGAWFFDLNKDRQYGAGDLSSSFGQGVSNAIPIVGPWNRPGRSNIGIYINGTWYLDTNGDNLYDAGDQSFSFGFPGAHPVIGDWTGNGISRIGVMKDGLWYVDINGNHIFDAGDTTLTFGITGDYPIVGDWTNTGLLRIGVYRGNGVWIVDTNGNNVFDAGDQFYFFGFAGAIPVVGDWTGDGRQKIGVFDPRSGQWYLDLNGNGTFDVGEGPFQFGLPNDQPAVLHCSIQ